MSRPALKLALDRHQRAVEVEQCVLGGLLLDNQRWRQITSRIGADDFYRREHRLIFSAIESLCQENKPADVVTVAERLDQTGDLEAAVDIAYLGSLANNTPSAANVVAYSDLVRDHARQRRLLAAAMEIVNGDITSESVTALERAVAGVQEKPGPSLRAVDLSAIADCELNPTRYAIEPILPRGHVTLLGSHGGAGKSILALVFVAHVVCGRVWCGLPAIQGRALYVSLEDPGELVRYRLRRIADAFGLNLADVVGGVRVLDGSASDSVLVAEVNDHGTRRLAPTATMEEVEAAAKGYTVIVIDNASDAYDASENDRRMVRGFIRRLAQLARAQDAAVLLLAHIDKPGARFGTNGESYSGSTAWHNSVRSRLALTEQDSRISMAHEKNNLGKKIEPIPLEWSEGGVLVPAAGNATAARDAEDDKAVLAALKAAIDDGATVYAARSGTHSALSILRAYPDLPKLLKKDSCRFYTALSRLKRAGCVSHETFENEHRKQRVRLSVARVSPPYPLPTDARMGARQCVSPSMGGLAQDRRTGAPAQSHADDEEVSL